MQEIFFCCLSFLILYIDRNVISEQRHIFFSSFPICMFFISFSYLIALVKISSTVLKRSRKKEHSCLLLDLSEKTSSTSPLSIMLTIDFLCRVFFFFNQVRKFPSIPIVLRDFIMSARFGQMFLPYLLIWSCD